MMRSISKLKARLLMALAMLGTLSMQVAVAGTSIGTSGSPLWAKMEQWFQEFIDFMDGPFGLAVVIVSLIAAFCTWTMAPREGIVGPVLRVVVSALVILNVGTWIASF